MWGILLILLRLSLTAPPAALDYPPFFAYFSYLLGLPARYLLPKSISDEILRISASPIESWPTIAYMRMTVLVSELCLLWAVLKISSTKLQSTSSSAASSPSLRTVALAIFLHPGFVILDSIHFQYNGFLFGIMVISLAAAKEVSRGMSDRRVAEQILRANEGPSLRTQGRPLICANAFAALLNFKCVDRLSTRRTLLLTEDTCHFCADTSTSTLLLHGSSTSFERTVFRLQPAAARRLPRST